MGRAESLIQHLVSLGNEKAAESSQRFFKTGKGQYGEGDLFLGIRVPELRRLAIRYSDFNLEEIQILLSSGYHEVRLLALILLVNLFRTVANADKNFSKSRSPGGDRKRIYQFYLSNTSHINNWDSVDTSASYIVGAYLAETSTRSDRAGNIPVNARLLKLAKSDNLWERRIAIIATFYFIRQGEFYDTLALAKALLNDPEDLIHKAVGWMLREVGKRDKGCETDFLQQNAKCMPRTMLRYAIEKLSAEEKRYFMSI